MILWMILPLESFNVLQRRQYLTCDGRRIEHCHAPAYTWIAEEMGRRTDGPPPARVRYPLWAWKQWAGPGRARPDLRAIRHHYEGPFVRVEIELPGEHVLLSDYEAWHHVLNGWFLAASEAESDAFEADLKAAGICGGWPYREPFHSRVVESWQRIFDLNWSVEGWTAPIEKKSIQATFWRLDASQVRDATMWEGRTAAHWKS